MNGAESLLAAMTRNGIDVCFANPGTSEMHFVAALDRVPGMRCVLGLFEGVVTGAADGYARMADKPASTLLHLGPGLANGLPTCTTRAARSPRSSTSSATTRPTTAPTTRRSTADIEGPGAAVRLGCGPRRTPPPSARTPPPRSRPRAPPRARSRTLILPADASWGPLTTETLPPPGGGARSPHGVRRRRSTRPRSILRSGGTAALILGPKAPRGSCPLEQAGRIAAVTGARLYAPDAHRTHHPRCEGA